MCILTLIGLCKEIITYEALDEGLSVAMEMKRALKCLKKYEPLAIDCTVIEELRRALGNLLGM